ncbi:hypothetical protein [Burkholderia plantarii]|uniref:Uncharacterized protein n=1 Tax=Burkholderia plantarii TaxID=41899 RepID=A0A0B6RV51_BURPL|nr:hypothetical protein [Burkholderia plantarii]AJK46054.1 hypothetical protein BGL_1c15380 [Burkholderia plantarii]
MQEDPLVRSVRRKFSRTLTATINDAPTYPAVRVAVLNALSELWGRLLSLVDMVREDLRLDPAQPLLRFYMKGGNAFECVINPMGPAATQNGGGSSDWDTQIVVDPWAPLPLQNYLYALVEDLILDALRNCASEIARWNPEIVSPEELLYQESAAAPVYRYMVELDDPQTIRQVFDPKRIGLWLNTSRKLSDRTMPGAALPGLIFNEGIEPFLLFRLGYTWHARPLDWPAPAFPGAALGPTIERPLLMELIDVTLPRRNTVEAVEVWEDLESGHVQIDPTPVSLQYLGTIHTVLLPLPSLDYHFDEQALMLSEVAAGVSRSVDKVMSRFTRLAQIYNGAAPPKQLDYQGVMAAMAGVTVAQLGVLPAPVAAVTGILGAHGAGAVLAAAPGTPQYLALSMMYVIAARQIQYQGEACLAGRQLLNQIIGMLPSTAIAEAAASDDLALYSTVVRNGYLDSRRFPASGIDMSAWLRVQNPAQLEDTAQLLRSNLPRWLGDFAAQAANVPPNPTETWITRTFFGKILRVELRYHTTLRSAGMSREATLVVFADDRAVSVITLTVATPGEAPFLPDPLLPEVLLVSVVDQAEQRKVSAAVIKDFCIREALAKQLKMLEWLFPSIWRPQL